MTLAVYTLSLLSKKSISKCLLCFFYNSLDCLWHLSFVPWRWINLREYAMLPTRRLIHSPQHHVKVWSYTIPHVDLWEDGRILRIKVPSGGVDGSFSGLSRSGLPRAAGSTVSDCLWHLICFENFYLYILYFNSKPSKTLWFLNHHLLENNL